jgi:hypothetical protein
VRRACESPRLQCLMPSWWKARRRLDIWAVLKTRAVAVMRFRCEITPRRLVCVPAPNADANRALPLAVLSRVPVMVGMVHMRDHISLNSQEYWIHILADSAEQLNPRSWSRGP